MKLWTSCLFKMTWATYLILTSVYCLLGFLPYTYYEFVNAPLYGWVIWFVAHHAALYWVALLAAALGYWPGARKPWYLVVFGGLAAVGFWLTFRPFLPALKNDWSAYTGAVAALVPLIGLAIAQAVRDARAAVQRGAEGASLVYSNAVIAAVLVALLYGAGSQVRSLVENGRLDLHSADVELTAWSVLSHVLVAVVTFSILNLISLVAARSSRPGVWRLIATGLLVFLGIDYQVDRFLGGALSFNGWAAHVYAALLSAACTLVAVSLVGPLLVNSKSGSAATASAPRRKSTGLAIVILAALAGGVIALPTLIRGGDWNGIIQRTLVLMLWVAFTACAYSLRPHRTKYSLAVILAVLFFGIFSYKALKASDIWWGGRLGPTDDDISQAVDKYAANNASFQLAHDLLDHVREEPCDDLCRILREYTNIRHPEARTEVNLVEHLAPAAADRRPNIFLFVIDALRPDYLGAYNSRVDFTPNLDGFARDSTVLRNVYTQYAGTSLSEPVIWSGAMLLHAHYMQPFSKVNSLEKLLQADDYRMVVSWDDIVPNILSASDDVVKLDTGKMWKQLDICSTIPQTEAVFDRLRVEGRPIFFYTQPKNVHQFAQNTLPTGAQDHWRNRDGFNNRIAHEVSQVDQCMGRFFAYMKATGMYDNSIIILTSDHGDATGEFGRESHSTIIYPEVMRVPLIVHLPKNMHRQFVYDDSHLSALTDITPSLYYLLGHRPVVVNPVFGHPLFTETKEELLTYRRDELFMASDERAVYGVLAQNGRYLYVTYDSPARSMLFDLALDPNAEHNVLTAEVKRPYDQRIIEYLHTIADFYQYRPDIGSLLASTRH